MSIPEGRTSYFGRYEDKEKWRLINQTGLRFIVDPAGTGYSSCWDMNVSPYDGTLYAALCHEVGEGDQTRVIAYDYDQDKTWEQYLQLVNQGLLRPEIALGWRFHMPVDTPQQLAEIRRKFMPQENGITA